MAGEIIARGDRDYVFLFNPITQQVANLVDGVWDHYPDSDGLRGACAIALQASADGAVGVGDLPGWVDVLAGPYEVATFALVGAQPALADTFGELVQVGLREILAALQAGSSQLGSGAFAITVQVRDSGTPVQAVVTVQQAGVIVAWANTDPNGNVNAFALNAGSYTVLVGAGPQYQPLAPQALVVAGNATQTYPVTRQPVTPPALPGLCTIQCTVRNPVGGALVPGAKVTAQLTDLNVAVVGTVLTHQVGTGVCSGSGYCELQLVRRDYITKGRNTYLIQAYDPKGVRLFSLVTPIPAAANATLDSLLAS